MGAWQLQEAKAKLSELIDTAEAKGPQLITRRGKDAVMVISVEEWKALRQPPKRTLLEVLQSGPQFDLNIPPRGRLRHRKPVKF